MLPEAVTGLSEEPSALLEEVLLLLGGTTLRLEEVPPSLEEEDLLPEDVTPMLVGAAVLLE